MNKFDMMYRAFCDYRKLTQNHKELSARRKRIKKANVDSDFLEAKKFKCIIEEDWILQIEKGLEFVSNAIKEERQFITQIGEVVPIEKVKKVSKTSVSHLARHSNLITHVPEDEKNLVPDKIYMVEKLSDFAVYENRFLYMMLCYLRDFIDSRLQKLNSLSEKFDSTLKLNKTYQSTDEELIFELNFINKRKDNPKKLFDDNSSELFDRINACAHIVVSLLNTPLMMEVSKAPMIRPPVVKTNVLKLNNNFKNSLALYEYLTNYNKDGFIVEEVIKDFQPFNQNIADEISEIVNLTSFLAFKYGNDLEEDLKKAYELEEENKKKLEALKLVEQIKNLKRRVAESGMNMEEYMLLLEKRNRDLEKTSALLEMAKKEIELLNNQIEQLNEQISQLNKTIEKLNETIEQKNAEIAYLKQKYIDDINALKKAHELEIINLKNEHENEINELKVSFENEIEDLKAEFEAEKLEIKEEYDHEIEIIEVDYQNRLDDQMINYENQIKEMSDDYENKIEELNSYVSQFEVIKNELVIQNDRNIDNLNNLLEAKEQENKQLADNYEQKIVDINEEALRRYQELENNYNELLEQKRFISAELIGIRAQYNVNTDLEDYTVKERFEELEKEYLAFYNFFEKQYKAVKLKIRKELLWTKNKRK